MGLDAINSIINSTLPAHQTMAEGLVTQTMAEGLVTQLGTDQ